MGAAAEPGRRREGRAEAERRLLSAAPADFFIFGETVKEVPPDLWRRFRDRRHQVIWRSLQSLDLLKSFEERLDALIKEDGGKTGIGALGKLAEPLPYLERELLAAGVLSAAGGKAYLRRLAGTYPVPAALTAIARELNFARY